MRQIVATLALVLAVLLGGATAAAAADTPPPTTGPGASAPAGQAMTRVVVRAGNLLSQHQIHAAPADGAEVLGVLQKGRQYPAGDPVHAEDSHIHGDLWAPLDVVSGGAEVTAWVHADDVTTLPGVAPSAVELPSIDGTRLLDRVQDKLHSAKTKAQAAISSAKAPGGIIDRAKDKIDQSKEDGLLSHITSPLHTVTSWWHWIWAALAAMLGGMLGAVSLERSEARVAGTPRQVAAGGGGILTRMLWRLACLAPTTVATVAAAFAIAWVGTPWVAVVGTALAAVGLAYVAARWGAARHRIALDAAGAAALMRRRPWAPVVGLVAGAAAAGVLLAAGSATGVETATALPTLTVAGLAVAGALTGWLAPRVTAGTASASTEEGAITYA